MEGGDSLFSTAEDTPEIARPLMSFPEQEAHGHTADSPVKGNNKTSRVWSISPMRKDRELGMFSLEEGRLIGKISSVRRMEQTLLSSVL